MDFDAPATALAARFARAQVTPPTGYRNIRTSTANVPEQLPPTPCVLVFVADGAFDSGGGTRIGVHDWLVRFYYDQTTDLVRAQPALRKWLGVLVDQLKTSVQLGGAVDRATVNGYTLGTLDYAGETYVGIELRVGIEQSEGWAAVA